MIKQVVNDICFAVNTSFEYLEQTAYWFGHEFSKLAPDTQNRIIGKTILIAIAAGLIGELTQGPISGSLYAGLGLIGGFIYAMNSEKQTQQFIDHVNDVLRNPAQGFNRLVNRFFN